MSTPDEQRLADRYGTARRSGSSRRTAVVFAIIAVVVSAAIAVVAYRVIADTPISAERIAFTERPDNTMAVTIDVDRDQPGDPAVCIVRVRDISGAESGRREVYVPPSEDITRLRTVIQSGTPPVTADVFGCTYSVPDYLSR